MDSLVWEDSTTTYQGCYCERFEIVKYYNQDDDVLGKELDGMKLLRPY